MESRITQISELNAHYISVLKEIETEALQKVQRAHKEAEEILARAREHAELTLKDARMAREKLNKEREAFEKEKALFYSRLLSGTNANNNNKDRQDNANNNNNNSSFDDNNNSSALALLKSNMLDTSKVVLDVGGEIFHTTIATLRKYEDSMFNLMFSGRFSIPRDKDGRVFIDRDGTYFIYILNFMRNGEFIAPTDDPFILAQIKKEAQYYNITPLVRLLSDNDDKGDLGLTINSYMGEYQTKVLSGHTDNVYVLHYESSTGRLASGSKDRTIRLWNVATGECLATLQGHTSDVYCLHLDGDILASGSKDKTVRIWNLVDDGTTCIRVLEHNSAVCCLQFAGNKLISGSADNTIKIWNMETGECQAVLTGHISPVWCLQFDERKLVSCSSDKTVKVWDLGTKQCTRTLQGHTSDVYCLEFEGDLIASGGWDKTIRLWNAETGECEKVITSESSVECLQLRGQQLISGSQSGRLHVWDIETGQLLRTLPGHSDTVCAIQFEGNRIFSASYDKSIRVWEFSEEKHF